MDNLEIKDCNDLVYLVALKKIKTIRYNFLPNEISKNNIFMERRV